MYTGQYKPNFPYLGHQATITAGRIIFHANEDALFVFARKAVSVSTSGSLHVNASEGTFINSNTIELGLNATQPVMKGAYTVDELTILCNSIEAFAGAVGSMSETELEKAIPNIIRTASNLVNTAQGVKSRLPNLLSKTTKTS